MGMDDATEQRHIAARMSGPPKPERALDYEYAFIEPDAKSSTVAIWVRTVEKKVYVDAKGNIIGEDEPQIVSEGFSERKSNFAELYDKIEPLANLSPLETEAVKGFKNLANTSQYLSEYMNIDLSPAQKYMVQESKNIAHATKGRKGWLLDRLKTDKSVLETYGQRRDLVGSMNQGWQLPFRGRKE